MSANSKTARPLSPHLQVYKPQLTSMLSILHRATGVWLAIGLIVLVAWIFTIAGGEQIFNDFDGLFQNPIGQIALFAWSWAFFYHYCTGIRHLFWDSGYFLSIKNVYRTGWIAVAASVLITGYVWHNIKDGDWQALGTIFGWFFAAVIILGILAGIGLWFLGKFSGYAKRPNSMRSELGKVRGMGSAKEGTAHWWGLRVTSAALALLSINLLWSFFGGRVYGDYTLATYWISSPISAVMLLLFIGVGFHHAANGVQVVIEDYVHGEKLKTASVMAVKFIAVALAVLAAIAILKILFFTLFLEMIQHAQQTKQ